MKYDKCLELIMKNYYEKYILEFKLFINDVIIFFCICQSLTKFEMEKKNKMEDCFKYSFFLIILQEYYIDNTLLLILFWCLIDI